MPTATPAPSSPATGHAITSALRVTGSRTRRVYLLPRARSGPHKRAFQGRPEARSESFGSDRARVLRFGRRAPSLSCVRKVLVTGMSGTGKSTALDELSRRGFRIVDTDEPGWTLWDEQDAGYVWREDRIGEVLSIDEGPTLYVSGTVSNQGRFYPHFDAVVLLSAPAEVLLSRIDSRTTNRYGKTSDERQLILRQLTEVEPLLRATCTHEIDTTRPIGEVVARLVEIGEQDIA